MIELEPKTAEEYLVKFSRVYGYLLRHIEIDYIDIGEAADFVAVYVDMLNKRYHGNIILQNEINAETDQGFILALNIQPQSLLFHHICYKYILHKRHIRYIAYIGTFSDFPPHKHPHLRTSSLLKALSHN